MRLAYPILLLILLVLIASTWLSTNVLSDPETEAVAFLQDVRQGDIVKAVRQFGSNACRCPAKGGWASYLVYKSGQEHNLAFMLGHPFEIGTPKDSPIENHKEALIAYQKPEDFAVDVPITFSAEKYMPYFLPLKMAYGKDMTETEFENFVKDPDKDAWQGFTLRFRPGITSGSITPPKVTVPRDLALQFLSLTGVTEQTEAEAAIVKKTREANRDITGGAQPEEANNTDAPEKEEGSEIPDLTSEEIKKVLGESATDYLVPKDAGHVLDADGKPLADNVILSRLPKLKTALLRLHVVRRGKLQNWTIYHFGFMYPQLLLADGKTIKLQHDQRPN